MKKILAIALALVMVLGLASSALAVSWAAPAASSSASPFAIEVVKLGVNADVTGAKYYTVLTDAAAYNYSNIYFAIKLSVPSYANANSYYGNSGFLSGSKVKVTVNYTNVSGKSNETYYVQLTDAAQTLWYNGSGFDAAWTASLSNNCGCGDKHILNAVAVGNKEISIKACVGASGELKDIKIDGCYSVEEKTYYGVVPCVNCNPVNLSGFLFTGDCAAYGVFFSTNAAGKVTGAYAVDKCAPKTWYNGAVADFDKKLFGWAPSGTYTDCSTGSCGQVAFTRVQLAKGDVINAGWKTWVNERKAGDMTLDQTKAAFAKWMTQNDQKNVSAPDGYETLYYEKDSEFKPVTAWSDIKPDNFGAIATGLVKVADDGSIKQYDTIIYDTVVTGNGNSQDFWSPDSITTLAGGAKQTLYYYTDRVLKNSTVGYRYADNGQVQYLKTKYIVSAKEDNRLYKQTSATTINCDTNEASYLNAVNHLYALLGFTYADVAAGNVYMTKDILLANFGFSTSVCDTKTWGAYTAAITVATVAEVPATGSVTYVGFAMIVLAIAAAVVTKKVRA